MFDRSLPEVCYISEKEVRAIAILKNVAYYQNSAKLKYLFFQWKPVYVPFGVVRHIGGGGEVRINVQYPNQTGSRTEP